LHPGALFESLRADGLEDPLAVSDICVKKARWSARLASRRNRKEK
jgi:hypothetical protein